MQLPNDTQRHLIIGRTGSGKSQFASHTLSLRSYDQMPWVIANFKDDELLNELPATELDGLKLPKPKLMKDGLWMVRPDVDDWDGMEQLMKEIWLRTYTGLYVDEMLPISAPKHPALRRLLTQGRSRRCPLIMCTQRPVDLDRYAFSESEYTNIFALSDDRETEKIKDQTGILLDMDVLPSLPDQLPYSYHIDKIRRKVSMTPPAPDFNSIVDMFQSRVRKSTNRILI